MENPNKRAAKAENATAKTMGGVVYRQWFARQPRPWG